MPVIIDGVEFEAETVTVRYRRRSGLHFFVKRKGMLMQIMSLALKVGAPPVHVTVADQDQNPLPPGDITWALDASLVDVSFVADATGFMFSCSATAPASTGDAVATYTVNGVTGTLPVVVIVAAVTALTFLSP